MPTTHPRITRLALLTALLAFAVILLGGYTRLTNAGLSCPDWPQCYGYLTAPHTTQQINQALQKYPATPVNTAKAWTEMTHRYFAGTEGLLILILAFALRRRKISLALITLLITQILLGMLTVTEQLKPVIVLAHLLTGISLLSVLWWIYLSSRASKLSSRATEKLSSRAAEKLSSRAAEKLSSRGLTAGPSAFLKPTPSFRAWTYLAFIILFAQITLGGWVSTHYAALACIDFPYCHGQWLPALHFSQFNNDLITIHMLHRLGAILTATYLSIFAIFLMKHLAYRRIGIHILLLLVAQISLGVLNIIWLRPVGIALAHHAIGILLLMTLVTLLAKQHSRESL